MIKFNLLQAVLVHYISYLSILGQPPLALGIVVLELLVGIVNLYDFKGSE